MDKTEFYIKMSDCPEIFNECKFQGGDWFYADGKSWMVYEFNEELSLEEHRKHFEGIVFLPRQDQIQEMLIKEKFGDFGAHWDMCIDIPVQFVAKNPNLELCSMEQIWLSCYMLSIHQKIWSSKEEKWVKK